MGSAGWHPRVAVIAALPCIATTFATADEPDRACRLRPAHEIAVATTLDSLPDPPAAYLRARVAAMTDAAIADNPSGAAASTRNETVHFVPLDVLANDEGADQTSSTTLPRDRTEAEARYAARHWSKGGWLPWVLLERQEALERAFRAGVERNILREAGRVIHLSVDAAWPFNTTSASVVEGAALDRAGDSVRAIAALRVQVETLALPALRGRLAHEVRVHPGRYRAAIDPRDDIRAALIAARSALDDLRRIERMARSSCMVAHPDEAATEACLAERLAEESAPIIETRIEAGSLLAANLIGEAWRSAGGPPLTVPDAAPSAAASSESDSSDSGAGGLVGSTGSTVFHRPTCPHAQRIKPSNRVTFADVAAARAAQRRPCKTCKPSTP
jgi:hypothetical protein